MKLHSIIFLLLAMPLLQAAQMTETEYRRTRSEQMIEQVRALMEKENTSIDEIRNYNDQTPLMQAAFNGYIPALEYFLQLGADINLKNEYGTTALISAASNYSDTVKDTVEFLLKHGADSNAKNIFGATALQQALHSSRPTAAPAIIRDPNFKRENLYIKVNGIYPLHMAASRGYIDVVQALIDRKIDLDARDADNNTALMNAVKYMHPAIVELLVAHGANTELKDAKNMTAQELVFNAIRTAEDEYDRYEAQKAMPLLYSAFMSGKNKYQAYLKRKQQVSNEVSAAAFGNIQGYPLATLVTDYLPHSDFSEAETKNQQADTAMSD